MKSGKLNYLNAGCGTNYHSDWINVDIVSKSPDVIGHNFIKGIPFDDNSFKLVYNSHFIEHLDKSDAIRFLNECYRVLQPGGILRVVCPDLEQIARLYLEYCDMCKTSNVNEGQVFKYEWFTIELLDQLTREYQGGFMTEFIKNSTMILSQAVWDLWQAK